MEAASSAIKHQAIARSFSLQHRKPPWAKQNKPKRSNLFSDPSFPSKYYQVTYTCPTYQNLTYPKSTTIRHINVSKRLILETCPFQQWYAFLSPPPPPPPPCPFLSLFRRLVYTRCENFRLYIPNLSLFSLWKKDQRKQNHSLPSPIPLHRSFSFPPPKLKKKKKNIIHLVIVHLSQEGSLCSVFPSLRQKTN